jgi:hypothetical protein
VDGSNIRKAAPDMYVKVWREGGGYIGQITVAQGELSFHHMSEADEEGLKKILFETRELQDDFSIRWYEPKADGKSSTEVSRLSAPWLAIAALLYLSPAGYRVKLDTIDLDR